MGSEFLFRQMVHWERILWRVTVSEERRVVPTEYTSK
jgi:hypothetical protein